MDCYNSVFNCHINDADKRARKLLKKVYPAVAKEIKRIKKKHNGIMGIFKEPPSPSIYLYVGMVTAFVNQKEI